MITSQNDHAGATPVVREAWRRVWQREGTPKEILYSQAIASFETGYGRIGQFAEFAKRGMFNWGAEQKAIGASIECPPGYAKGQDQGTVCFRVFPSDEEAAANFISTLTKSKYRPDVVSAMAGSPEDVAKAMRGTDPPRTAYYAGLAPTEAQKIQAYADGIRSRGKAIAAALEKPNGAPMPIPQPANDRPIVMQTDTSSGWLELGAAAGVLYGLWKFAKRK